MPTHVGNGEDTQTGPSLVFCSKCRSHGQTQKLLLGSRDLLYHLPPLAQVRAF